MKKYTNKYKKEEKSNPSEKTLLVTPMTIKNLLITLFFGWILYSCCNIYYEAGQKKKLDEQKKEEWCRNNPDACARYEEAIKSWYRCQGMRNVIKSAGGEVGKLDEDCPFPSQPWK